MEVKISSIITSLSYICEISKLDWSIKKVFIRHFSH